MKVIKKSKLEETKPYAFDKKVLEREMAKGRSDPSLFYQTSSTPVEDLDLITMRRDMKNVGDDITEKEIIEISKIIKIGKHRIQIFIYKEDNHVKNRPVVMFMHGGGFFGGDGQMRANQCKYLAEQSGAVVVSPDYRLAPENPYPAAVEDVQGTIQWIVSNEGFLEVNAEKFVVAGDSAGGTLAANCCRLDKEKRIKLAVYIYAGMDSTAAEETPYHWDYSMYGMDEEQKEYLMNRLYRFKSLTESVQKLYIPEGYSVQDEGISPLYMKDLSQMPRSLIIEAEFDYFRVSNDLFAQRLYEAGRDVEVILYEGMDHAFFDRIGIPPQVKDCIEEMARRIKEI